ncbi:hypothetical protein B0H13DRAFT_2581548 [Mycena leptocephala]|nr:hypothetical protein B0H13DRAFT_2581548 [Mycena leptocephala]
MAEIGMLKDVWDAKISLCWWHLRRAVRTRLAITKLTTTPYDPGRVNTEFSFIDVAFVPTAQADGTEYEGAVPDTVTPVPDSLLKLSVKVVRLNEEGRMRAKGQAEVRSVKHLGEEPITIIEGKENEVPETHGAVRTRAGRVTKPTQNTEAADPKILNRAMNARVTGARPADPKPAKTRDPEPGDESEEEEGEDKPSRRTFCPARLREPIVNMMEKHFCAHPLLPGYAHPSAEGIKRWAVTQMYKFCVEHGLQEVRDYLWENWYRSSRWELWARSIHEEIPVLKTTMILESQSLAPYQAQFLHHFHMPRCDLLAWILVVKLAPTYYRKLDRLLTHTGRYCELPAWRKTFKREWRKLEKKPITLAVNRACVQDGREKNVMHLSIAADLPLPPLQAHSTRRRACPSSVFPRSQAPAYRAILGASFATAFEPSGDHGAAGTGPLDATLESEADDDDDLVDTQPANENQPTFLEAMDENIDVIQDSEKGRGVVLADGQSMFGERAAVEVNPRSNAFDVGQIIRNHTSTALAVKPRKVQIQKASSPSAVRSGALRAYSVFDGAVNPEVTSPWYSPIQGQSAAVASPPFVQSAPNLRIWKQTGSSFSAVLTVQCLPRDPFDARRTSRLLCPHIVFVCSCCLGIDIRWFRRFNCCDDCRVSPPPPPPDLESWTPDFDTKVTTPLLSPELDEIGTPQIYPVTCTSSYVAPVRVSANFHREVIQPVLDNDNLSKNPDPHPARHCLSRAHGLHRSAVDPHIVPTSPPRIAHVVDLASIINPPPTLTPSQRRTSVTEKLRPRVNQGPTADDITPPLTGYCLGPSQDQLCPNSKIPDDRKLVVLLSMSRPLSFMAFTTSPLAWHILWTTSGVKKGSLKMCESTHLSSATGSSRRRACQFLLEECLAVSIQHNGRADNEDSGERDSGDGAPTPEWQKDARHYLFYLSSEDIGHSLPRALPRKLGDQLMDMITGMALLKMMTKMSRAAAEIKRRTKIRGR